MTTLYNDTDKHAAAWTRELIAQGHISEGIVDERSIADLTAADLAGYERVHLFSGIGGWDYALRLAGWPDGVPVWTGSCPCQPFSVAGKRKGTADARHLWPEMFRLIDLCRPPIVFGEQVASKDARKWLNGVRADLETLGYAVGAADLCAASVGAPHIRQRLYWVAISDGGLQDSSIIGWRRRDNRHTVYQREQSQPQTQIEGPGSPGGVPDCHKQGLEGWPRRERTGQCTPGTRSPWSNYDIIPFRDGKIRRVERKPVEMANGLSTYLASNGIESHLVTETFPLIQTHKGRNQLLKGYGNAINAPLAATFVQTVMDILT